MEISASDVKELRERTGLGMMLCKKALMESNGDMAVAIENLRKQGQAAVAKRAGRAAKQGIVTIVTDASSAIVYEVNAETDFVAKNSDFIAYVEAIGNLLIAHKPTDVAAVNTLSDPSWSGLTAGDKITELISKIGENMSFRRFSIETVASAQEKLFTYIHGEGRIGVIVKLSSDKADALSTSVAADLGKDIAMQIAAANPSSLDRNAMNATMGDVIAKEKEIYFTQAQTSGKPEKVWDKIVEGKLDKFYKEATLLEQAFIKTPEISVTDRINEAGKAASAQFSVVSFVRYELGAE
jgi:elongation factor Ts